MKLENIKTKLEQIRGKKQYIEGTITLNKIEIRKHARELSQYEEARDIIRTVAQKTQSQIEYKISELTSLAISAIFPEPYKFVTEFVLKRNKTEANFYVETENGNRFHPLNANGGGLVDIISFGLRITIFAIKKPYSSPIIILDEPFRFLSRDLQQKAGELLKELSKKFNLQFIIISHDTPLIDCADKVFKVEKNGHSNIFEIGDKKI